MTARGAETKDTAMPFCTDISALNSMAYAGQSQPGQSWVERSPGGAYFTVHAGGLVEYGGTGQATWKGQPGCNWTGNRPGTGHSAQDSVSTQPTISAEETQARATLDAAGVKGASQPIYDALDALLVAAAKDGVSLKFGGKGQDISLDGNLATHQWLLAHRGDGKAEGWIVRPDRQNQGEWILESKSIVLTHTEGDKVVQVPFKVCCRPKEQIFRTALSHEWYDFLGRITNAKADALKAGIDLPFGPYRNNFVTLDNALPEQKAWWTTHAAEYGMIVPTTEEQGEAYRRLYDAHPKRGTFGFAITTPRLVGWTNDGPVVQLELSKRGFVADHAADFNFRGVGETKDADRVVLLYATERTWAPVSADEEKQLPGDVRQKLSTARQRMAELGWQGLELVWYQTPGESELRPAMHGTRFNDDLGRTQHMYTSAFCAGGQTATRQAYEAAAPAAAVISPLTLARMERVQQNTRTTYLDPAIREAKIAAPAVKALPITQNDAVSFEVTAADGASAEALYAVLLGYRGFQTAFQGANTLVATYRP
jgi:hypothetical protein